MFTADATRELCKSLTVKELRTQCRSRNINPGGNVEALRQRLEDSMRETGDSSIVQDLPAAEQEEDQGFSKNNYARPGGVQNVGNRITDRPSSRVLAPPGGVSQVVFGGGQDAPAPYVSKRGGPGALPTTVDKSLYGGDAKEPSDQARAPPAGGFKGLSQVSFGEYQLPSYTTQNPTAAAHTKSSAERVHDDLVLDVDKMMKSLMVKDLRNNCRARNLSPAGGAEQLRQRLGEHMVATGDVQLVVEGDSDLPSGAGPQPAPPAIAYGAQSGMSEPTASNNYVRPAGQNVGNFLTGRSSSRVLAPPGGVSTIMLG